MARILDEASVRVSADTRPGERDAETAGERFGRAFARGANRGGRDIDLTSQLTADVEAASVRLRAAREQEAGAAQRVITAEQELSRLRTVEPGNVNAIAVAERGLDSAITDHVASTRRATDADTELTQSRRALSDETDRHSGVLVRLRSAFEQSTAAGEDHRGLLDRLRVAVRGAGDDTDRSSGLLRGFGNAARDSDGPLDGLLTKLGRLGLAAQGLKLFLTPTLFAELIPPVLGLGAALVQASGSLLILPGALATLGVSFAAIKIATSGFGDALKEAFKNPGDINAVNEALKNLSPSAQEAARAILTLKTPWDAFRQSIQEDFFRGLGPEIVATAQSLMNNFRPAFLAIASTANTTLKGILTDLRGVRESADLRSIGQSSSTVFANLAAAVRPLLQALLDIATVGAKVFADITGGAGAATQKFADFIARIKESGQLESIIRGGLNALKELGQIAVNVGSALGSIFKASAVDGKTFLDTLRDGTKAFADFAKSIPGQELFGAFFAVLRDLQSALAEVLALAPAVTPVLQALHQGLSALFVPLPQVVSGIAALLVALAPLLPLAGQVGGAIASGLARVFTDLAPIVANIVTGIKGLVTNAMPGLITGFTAGWAATKPLLEALGQLALVILPPLGTALGAIATIIGPFAPVILALLAAWKAYSIIMGVVTVATDLFKLAQEAALVPMLATAGPVIAIVAALALLGLAIYEVVQNWDTIKAAMGGFIDYASSTFMTGLDQIGSGISTFASYSSSTFMDGLQQMGTGIGSFFSYAGSTFATGLQQIGSGIASFASYAAQTFITGLQQMGDIALNSLNYIGTVFSNGFNQVGTAVLNGVNTAVDYIAGLPGRAVNALGNVGSLLYNAGTALVSGFIQGIAAWWPNLTSWVSQGLTNLRALFPFSPAKRGPFSGRGYVSYSGKALTADFATAIGRGMPGVVNAVRDLVTAASGVGQVDLQALFPQSLGLSSAGTGRTTGAAGGQVPNVLDQAAAVVNNIVVNNPVAERSTDSINRELRKFAALGGFSR